MEQNEEFQLKVKVFQKAIKGFRVSLKVKTNDLSFEIIDLIKSGRVQKFEYCIELTWKIIKKLLYVYHNVDAKSPRDSIKEFYLIGAVSEEKYEHLLKMLDDRNKLSHIYNEVLLEEIHSKLNDYYEVMDEVEKYIKLKVDGEL